MILSSSTMRAFGLGTAILLTPAVATSVFAQESTATTQAPNAQMKAVLDDMKALGAEPIGTLSVAQARMQATPADAAAGVQRERMIPPGPEAKVTTKDFAIPTPKGKLLARAYVPKGDGPFPMVVYYHGGGWVIADINTYDATPRALALGANAVVVSVEYRHAPEHKFPAAHEDAFAAYKWLVENGGALNADAKRVAVAGESAGGNLAANVALMAKQMKITQPVHQLLVYPVAGSDKTTPSYKENQNTVPLGSKDLAWFFNEVLPSKSDAKDKRLDLVNRDDLAGLAPATVILAQIDPLRSEGEVYAANLKKAGVDVNLKIYPGVTHEFFGMGKVVDEAKQAEDLAAADLKKAFGKGM